MLRKTMLAALVAGAFAVIVAGPGAIAETTAPADKAAVTANDVDTVGSEQPQLVLEEQMKVDSTIDLILQVSAECSILTSLMTEGNPDAGATDTDGAFGQVKMWLTIDGTVVPVSANDTPTDESGDSDEGEVVFCNRGYARTVTDAEDEQDGIDEEDDFIRTRTANAFNWMAFDVGTAAYDDEALNGNNIVDIQLWAQYDRETNTASGDDAACGEEGSADNLLTPLGRTCADAFIGSRTLIVEATHAANGETYEPEPATTEPEPEESGTSIGGVSLP
jgi:hypothetical protein